MEVKVKVKVKSKKLKKEVTEIGLLLDKSGSMYGTKSDTIGGVNTFIDEQKSVEGDANITILLFSEEFEYLTERENIKDTEHITGEDYKPEGNTALYDALMKLIAKLEATGAKKVVIAVMTDGFENASKEFHGKVDLVKAKIEEKQKAGWQFTFLAANLDAHAYAATMGVSMKHTQNFTADASGIKGAACFMSRSVTNYRTQQTEE